MSTKFIKANPVQHAVWGGEFARSTGQDDTWLGIPTGYQLATTQFGTVSTDPDATYSVSTTSDDLCTVIWQPLTSIRVTKCRIHVAQGGSTNTAHVLCLMRYDIDADGDLSNGVKVAGQTVLLNSDDYSHLRKADLVVDTDNAKITSDHVLVGMVYCSTAINAYMAAKCIIEYNILK
jgi:hypothetical protein